MQSKHFIHRKLRLLPWSIFAMMMVVLALIAGVVAMSSTLNIQSRAAELLPDSLASLFFPQKVQTIDGQCGVLGGPCCAAASCTGKLSNGKLSSCTYYVHLDGDKQIVDALCAMPQLQLDVTQSKEDPSIVKARLLTNAVGDTQIPDPMSFMVDCDSENPESSHKPDTQKSDKQSAEFSCTYPLRAEEKTYMVKGWMYVAQGGKNIELDPISKKITIGAQNSSFQVDY